VNIRDQRISYAILLHVICLLIRKVKSVISIFVICNYSSLVKQKMEPLKHVLGKCNKLVYSQIQENKNVFFTEENKLIRYENSNYFEAIKNLFCVRNLLQGL